MLRGATTSLLRLFSAFEIASQVSPYR